MEQELRYENIEALTLEKVPEIWKDYYEFGWDPIPYPTPEWLEELHHIPLDDDRRLGDTILFESILVPFMMSLFEDKMTNQQRIREIMDWIEELAQHQDRRIWRTLVGVCVCEQILDRYGELLSQVFPYFGPRTQQICRDHAKHLNLKETVRQYLAEK